MQVEVIPSGDSPRKVSFELAKGMSKPARSLRSAMTGRPRGGDDDRGAEHRICWERALKGRLRFEPGLKARPPLRGWVFALLGTGTLDGTKAGPSTCPPRRASGGTCFCAIQST